MVLIFSAISVRSFLYADEEAKTPSAIPYLIGVGSLLLLFPIAFAVDFSRAPVPTRDDATLKDHFNRLSGQSDFVRCVVILVCNEIINYSLGQNLALEVRGRTELAPIPLLYTVCQGAFALCAPEVVIRFGHKTAIYMGGSASVMGSLILTQVELVAAVYLGIIVRAIGQAVVRIATWMLFVETYRPEEQLVAQGIVGSSQGIVTLVMGFITYPFYFGFGWPSFMLLSALLRVIMMGGVYSIQFYHK